MEQLVKSLLKYLSPLNYYYRLICNGHASKFETHLPSAKNQKNWRREVAEFRTECMKIYTSIFRRNTGLKKFKFQKLNNTW